MAHLAIACTYAYSAAVWLKRAWWKGLDALLLDTQSPLRSRHCPSQVSLATPSASKRRPIDSSRFYLFLQPAPVPPHGPLPLLQPPPLLTRPTPAQLAADCLHQQACCWRCLLPSPAASICIISDTTIILRLWHIPARYYLPQASTHQFPNIFGRAFFFSPFPLMTRPTTTTLP